MRGEQERAAEKAVAVLMRYVGVEPHDNDGTRGTPARVARSLLELTRGYGVDPKDLLSVTFTVEHDELVLLDGIRFTSLCEHHLLPFQGVAAVAYIPGQHDRVVGISKLARLVECFACRLQVQERLTKQVADALVEHLEPAGVVVVIRAHHECMGCRGVRQPSAAMTTSAIRGRFVESDAARAELMALVRLDGQI